MNLIERTISVLCQVLLWISTVVIFAILVGNTILRYATGSSLQWANEVPELLFPWLVMSGVVLAAQHGAHITTSFLMDKMSGAARRLWSALGWAVVSVPVSYTHLRAHET
jgi:TRAP-type C4-dicarboxylate transport system permease small subunit